MKFRKQSGLESLNFASLHPGYVAQLPFYPSRQAVPNPSPQVGCARSTQPSRLVLQLVSHRGVIASV